LRTQWPSSGKIEHFAGNVLALEVVKELESFADVEAVVELAVDHQRRRLEVFG